MSTPSSPPTNRPDPRSPEDDEDSVAKPVITGLVALFAVALTVGILVGAAALIATRMAGIDGGSTATGEQGNRRGQETLYLPTPSDTEGDDGPSISLAPGATASTPSQPTSSETEDEPSITLQGPSTVRPMENIDLTGVYPDGEGAVLQVQRFEEGEWVDFLAINALVSNSTFSTTVQTSRTGPMKWRMIDTKTKVTSNPITVTVEP